MPRPRKRARVSVGMAILMVSFAFIGNPGSLDGSALAATQATITLTPDQGSCGTRVTVHGEHFRSGSEVSLSVALAGGDSGVILGKAVVADDGRFIAEFAVDDVVYGCQDGPPVAPDGTAYLISADTIRADPGNGYGPPAALATFTIALTPAERFQVTWARTDQPVARGYADRTWIWGPGPMSVPRQEPYDESPNQTRTVQYFDKGRMEDNSYRSTSPWDVTNGLLVVEMVEGKIQLGDTRFDESPEPTGIPVAGDLDDAASPTYATMALIRDKPAAADGESIIVELSRDGMIVQNVENITYNVRAAHRVTVDGIDHQVASPFWDFMNATSIVWQYGQYVEAPLFGDPFYATGYPITEAYWSNVTVGGTDRKVLLQCFERRCLTFTPDNPVGWQVEAGNVGGHYYRWRHDPSVDQPMSHANTAEHQLRAAIAERPLAESSQGSVSDSFVPLLMILGLALAIGAVRVAWVPSVAGRGVAGTGHKRRSRHRVGFP